MDKHLLFVYGTLKSTHGNHRLLWDSQYLGLYETNNNYSLYQDGLPFLLKEEGQGAVGELYEIDRDTLRRTDRLEGHPDFYRRERIWIKNIKDGSIAKAWTYLGPVDWATQFTESIRVY